MNNLAQKCYQSVVEVLKNSNKVVPSWEETSEKFRNEFEAELNEGLRKLGYK
jgi:hypothetical protein